MKFPQPSKTCPTIAQARVEVGGKKASAPVKSTEQGATLRLELPAGRTTLNGWFEDATGQGQCGAFFVRVK